jgi:hypothetical protein
MAISRVFQTPAEFEAVVVRKSGTDGAGLRRRTQGFEGKERQVAGEGGAALNPVLAVLLCRLRPPSRQRLAAQLPGQAGVGNASRRVSRHIAALADLAQIAREPSGFSRSLRGGPCERGERRTYLNTLLAEAAAT